MAYSVPRPLEPEELEDFEQLRRHFPEPVVHAIQAHWISEPSELCGRHWLIQYLHAPVIVSLGASLYDPTFLPFVYAGIAAYAMIWLYYIIIRTMNIVLGYVGLKTSIKQIPYYGVLDRGMLKLFWLPASRGQIFYNLLISSAIISFLLIKHDSTTVIFLCMSFIIRAGLILKARIIIRTSARELFTSLSQEPTETPKARA